MGFNPMKVTTKRVLRKLGGDKISGKVILPKTEVVGGSSYNGILGLVAGQKYVVALHDDEHDLTVEVVAEAEGDYVFFSDGAHFEIGDDHSSNEWYIDFGDFSGTLSIFIPETIHPIDPKYLPKGGVGYEEKTSKVTFPKTELTMANGAVTLYPPNGFDMNSDFFTEGHINIVIWDGVRYECQSKKGSSVIWTCGDRDDGTPFYIKVLKSSGNVIVNCYDDMDNSVASSTHTLEILDVEETIHPIDPKYLVTEIRPADYGLDIVALINSGVKNTQISGTDAFWSEINRGYDFRIVADVDQASMSIIPQIITKAGGEIMSVGFVAQFVAGSMLTVVNVDLTNGRGMTYFRCGINNLDLG